MAHLTLDFDPTAQQLRLRTGQVYRIKVQRQRFQLAGPAGEPWFGRAYLLQTGSGQTSGTTDGEGCGRRLGSCRMRLQPETARGAPFLPSLACRGGV